MLRRRHVIEKNPFPFDIFAVADVVLVVVVLVVVVFVYKKGEMKRF